MKASRAAALAAAVAILLVGAFYVWTQRVTVPPSSTSSSTMSVSTVTSVTTAGSASSSSGLQLRLAVNASSSGPSNSVAFQIRVSEYNTLATANNVTAGRQWALAGLSLGTCGTEFYPFGVALYRGSYTPANASGAMPLRFHPMVPCPLLIRLVTGYLFQPMSELAVVLPGGPGAATVPISADENATAEYPGGPQASSTPLTPGTYTVAAGDEWGSVVLIRLTIGAGASTSSSGTGTAGTGTLLAAFDVGPTQPVCRVNATKGPAPDQYSSIQAVVNSRDSGQTVNLPLSWLSTGCSVSGTVQASLMPGTYSLSLSSCPWMGCSTSFPTSFTVTLGHATSVKVSIDTGIR